MKNNLYIFKNLIPAILLFAGAVFFQKKTSNSSDLVINVAKIEKTVSKLEVELESVLKDFSKKISEKKFIENQKKTWLINEDLKNLTDKEFTVLIYKNDSIKYWSDNGIPEADLFLKETFVNGKVAQIGNALYKISIKTLAEIKLVGLIKLKNKFPFENKYLTNSFRKDFDLPSSILLSPLPAPQGSNIKGKDGTHLFSLIQVDKKDFKKEHNFIIGIMFFLGFALFLIFLNSVCTKLLKTSKLYSVYISLILVVTLVLRYFSIKYKFPEFVYSLNYFNPKIYSGELAANNIGDLFINSLIFVFLSSNIFKIFNFKELIVKLSNFSPILKYLVAFIFSSFIYFHSFFIFEIISDLLEKADIKIQVYNIPELDSMSLLVYSTSGFLILSFIVFAERSIKLFTETLNSTRFLPVFLISSIIFAGLMIFSDNKTDISAFLLSVSIVMVLTLIRLSKFNYKYYINVFLILLVSIWFVLVENDITKKKETEKLKELAPVLVDQRDKVAELLIREEENKMQNDTTLIGLILNTGIGQANLIHTYLEKNYFHGFWKKYDFVVTICGNDKNFRDENTDENCSDFYNNMVLKKAKKLDSSNYYFIDNHNGTISYWSFIKIPEAEDDRKLTLYIQLNSKIVSKELGYPELLLQEDNVKNPISAKYSYSRYTNGKLVTISGEFPYNLTDSEYKSDKEFKFFELNDYLHLIYKPDKENSVIISTKSSKPVNLLISFAYLFVFFNIITIFSILIVDIKTIISDFKPDFKNKIRFSMIFVLLITFVTFGSITIYYSIEQQKKFRDKEMSGKIHSVLTELEHNFSLSDEIEPDWNMGKYSSLDELLTSFSHTFFSDINLYDLNGFLLATSRQEIFKQGLVSNRMNSMAYKKLVIEQKTQVIQNESIGQLEFASVYIPFKNHENKVIAYLNLPYFSNADELQENISNLLVTIINIYVVLLLISILIAFFISTKITQPLKMLQDKFKGLKLGKKHQAIEYDRDDEIGKLVFEYNRMSAELSDNVKKLTETERDTAWREMAKQIAHEIKNPLTPMKLSIQLLQRAWNDKKPDFDERMEKVSNTVIEQIDTLSSIASEFSAFAKMPKAQEEEVDIISKVETVVQLFETTKDTDVTLNVKCDRNIKIIADKEQLSRVFINLIKNGIQSVPRGVHGIINVEIISYAGKIKVTITDNGSGIPEDRRDKLFIPNFTTKTTGMGMGLAIVRNIIKNADGEIWFESEVGVGTSFFVEFPIYKKDN